MQRNRASPPHRHVLHWSGLAGLLLSYVFATTSLAPAMVALLAAADRSHDVAIRPAAHGLQVVLRHDVARSPTHSHGPVARALTFFAQRTTSPRSDHVIQFDGVEAGQAPATVVAPMPELQSAAALAACHSLLPALRLHSSFVNFPRPPPASRELLLLLHSTVLAI